MHWRWNDPLPGSRAFSKIDEYGIADGSSAGVGAGGQGRFGYTEQGSTQPTRPAKERRALRQ